MQQQENFKNWAGNYTYSTNNIYYPQSVEEVQALVKKHDKLKVLGSRHCFNSIADSKDCFISLQKLNKVIALNEQAKTVTVEGGINYGELSTYLHEKGFALHNLASLPHISVAGACATATHGSGVKNGNLATAVVAVEMINAQGEIIAFSKENDGENFNAIVVSLGGIGIVAKLTLQVEHSFMLCQYVYEQLPLEQLKNNFNEIVGTAYSVSLFTNWQSECINEVWIKSLVNQNQVFNSNNRFFGATAATKNMHPIANISAENCTEQMGVPGPWHMRLPHFKMGFTPSSGEELQSEYFVPHAYGWQAVLAIANLGKQIAPHLLISEIRTINADDFWMSPCYKQSCVAIHFTWKQNWPVVQQLLPIIEKALAPFNAKPHWGKLFTMPAQQLHTLYPKLPAFIKTLNQYDATGKFRNDFLNNTILGKVEI